MIKNKKLKLKPILIIIFLIYFVVTFFQQGITLNKLDKRYNEIKSKEATALNENKYLKDRIKYMQSDSFIEEEARQKLGLVKKGEIIYIDKSKEKINTLNKD
ncbi:septum formation initiator family protein [Aceticella autotrophica]|uniref:Septum formation initiator family protein n=1 Tax=Aceticella autotrophica TaxID=2755338 RepID=A0A975GAN1_9THEO|nr:septum formation initiator family protein [Aceticella autotrophica]QSZ27563.1 septum formation initiator family protein [Aceticella autotrophica]